MVKMNLLLKEETQKNDLFNFNGHGKQALIDKVVKLMQMKKRRKYEQILRDYIAMTHIRELYV